MAVKLLTKKELEALKNDQPKLQNNWDKNETELLEQLVDNGICSTSYIYKKGLLPGRTERSIEGKIKRYRRKLRAQGGSNA